VIFCFSVHVLFISNLLSFEAKENKQLQKPTTGAARSL